MKTYKITSGPGGPLLEYRKPEIGEFRAFEVEVGRLAIVYAVLERARDSYAGGRADYENATEAIKHLIDESNKAAQEIVNTCSKIDRWFFSPPGAGTMPSDFFSGRGNEFLAFVKRWIADQYPEEGLVKNLPRARSAKSRRARPATARSAKGSSLTAKEPPPLPA